jgi:thimet oligopeptidase
MKKLTVCLLLLAAAAWAGNVATFWTLPPTAEALEKQSKDAFDQARSQRDRLLAVEGPRTVQNTLVPFDEIGFLISGPRSTASVLSDTHPDASFRKVALKTLQDARSLLLEIQLDPRIYRALASLERVEGLDAATSYYVQTTLQALRNGGVDQPEEVRQQIRAMRVEIVKLQQQFDRNIVEGRATLSFEPEALDGVPQDFVRSHMRDGKVWVSNDASDSAVSYAKSQDVRRKAFFLFQNRGYPANMEVLLKLIDLRQKVAALCGFSTFANMQAQLRMIGSEAKQRAFLDEVDRASRPGAAAEAATILEAKRRDQPNATAVDAWDFG